VCGVQLLLQLPHNALHCSKVGLRSSRGRAGRRRCSAGGAHLLLQGLDLGPQLLLVVAVRLVERHKTLSLLRGVSLHLVCARAGGGCGGGRLVCSSAGSVPLGSRCCNGRLSCSQALRQRRQLGLCVDGARLRRRCSCRARLGCGRTLLRRLQLCLRLVSRGSHSRSCRSLGCCSGRLVRCRSLQLCSCCLCLCALLLQLLLHLLQLLVQLRLRRACCRQRLGVSALPLRGGLRCCLCRRCARLSCGCGCCRSLEL
jgi:hypothetical protein